MLIANERIRQLVESGMYIEAYVEAVLIMVDDGLLDTDHAEALAIMGDLVAGEPRLAVAGCDSGIKYYIEALRRDSKNLRAHLGVVREYGPAAPGHGDRDRRDASISILRRICSQVPEAVRAEVRRLLGDE